MKVLPHFGGLSLQGAGTSKFPKENIRDYSLNFVPYLNRSQKKNLLDHLVKANHYQFPSQHRDLLQVAPSSHLEISGRWTINERHCHTRTARISLRTNSWVVTEIVTMSIHFRYYIFDDFGIDLKKICVRIVLGEFIVEIIVWVHLSVMEIMQEVLEILIKSILKIIFLFLLVMMVRLQHSFSLNIARDRDGGGFHVGLGSGRLWQWW